MSTHVVVGGQYGSEAKGHVAAILAARLDVETGVCVRIGGPNAGHSVIDPHGRKFAFRTVPVAAVVNPAMTLVLGPGSEIEESVLAEEIMLCETHGYEVRNRLAIDRQATVLTDAHHTGEAGMQARLGSTAKGIGACRADRLMRTAHIVGDDPERWSKYGCVTDTGPMLNRAAHASNDRVIIEGTQGYGLGLHAGHYPFCTSGDCRTVDFLAQAGITAQRAFPWVVFRTYPIRVAGNSGPLKRETSWDYLNILSGGYIEPEFTTVTKKMRRVGHWDMQLAKEAIDANGGLDTLALRPVLSFVDYLDPKLAGATRYDQLLESSALDTITEWEIALGVDFALFTTGPDTHIWRNDHARV